VAAILHVRVRPVKVCVPIIIPEKLRPTKREEKEVKLFVKKLLRLEEVVATGRS
jgi:hypothetical protein